MWYGRAFFAYVYTFDKANSAANSIDDVTRRKYEFQIVKHHKHWCCCYNIWWKVGDREKLSGKWQNSIFFFAVSVSLCDNVKLLPGS